MIGFLTTYKTKHYAHYSVTSLRVSNSLSLNRWEECLPPTGYRPQYITTICPVLTSLTVGPPWLFQLYAS